MNDWNFTSPNFGVLSKYSQIQRSKTSSEMYNPGVHAWQKMAIERAFSCQ